MSNLPKASSKILPIGGGRVEIVMNELQKLKMSADFFENTSHDICRCPGVQSVIVYWWDVIANVDITLLLSKPGALW